MKKIVFFDCRYQSFYGAQKSMVQLIKTMPKNYKIVFVTTKKGELIENIIKNNIESIVLKLGRNANVFGGGILKYSILKKIFTGLEIFFFQIKFLFFLKEQNIDFLYLNDPRSFVISFVATKFLRIKTITYIRFDLENTLVNRLCIKYSDSIITIAEGLLAKIPAKIINKKNKKIKNIYTGFDFENFDFESKLKGINHNKMVIGYVASISPRKGLNFFIDIMIKNENLIDKIQLIIAGEAPKGCENYWSEIKKKLEIHNFDYIYLGYEKNVHKVFNSIDILALPTKSEGLPRVIIEAMAHKVPVISNDVGGVNQIIDNGKNGFVINNGDERTWIKTLEVLLISKKGLKKIGEKASISVRNKFNKITFEKNIRDYFGGIND